MMHFEMCNYLCVNLEKKVVIFPDLFKRICSM
jgi:hypothetical protein